MTRAPKADGRECVLNTPRPATPPQPACESAPGPADARAIGVAIGVRPTLTRAQVYELDGFRVTHASRYPAPVLSLGLSPDCGLLAVGTADGALCVRRHRNPKPAAAGARGAAPARRVRYGPRLSAANYRYIVRGRSEKAAADDVRVAARRRARLAPYDRDLRQFRRGPP